MRYAVEHDGLFLQVARKGFTVRRTWVDLQTATTWAKPGHAKLAANLTGIGLVTVWEVDTRLVKSHGTHTARKAR
jgi:hypothetical protein